MKTACIKASNCCNLVGSSLCVVTNNNDTTEERGSTFYGPETFGNKSRTYRRFHEFGERLIMGPDLGPYNNGPEWTWSFLQWETIPEGQAIRSPMLRTEADYFIPE